MRKTVGNTGMGLFWFFCAGVALVSLGLISLGPTRGYPGMAHHLPVREIAFVGHVVGASIALLLMPFQFWGKLRAKRPHIHRWVGRTYMVAVLAGGVSGAILAPYAMTGTIAAAGFFTLAVLWLLVTALGLITVRKRNFAAHKRWMIRSAALTFAAVTLRLYLASSLVSGVPIDTAYPIIAWACWLPNLAIAEYWLRRSRIV